MVQAIDRKLTYQFYNQENAIPGGNEFRLIDLRSTQQRLNFVGQINALDRYSEISIIPEQPQGNYSYVQRPDFNGAYVIANYENPNFPLQADYVWCTFILKSRKFEDEKIYVTKFGSGSLINDFFKVYGTELKYLFIGDPCQLPPPNDEKFSSALSKQFFEETMQLKTLEVELTQVKTKEQVAVPMTKVVENLLSKYNFTIPKISNQKFNDYLYEVVKQCEGLNIEVKKIAIQGGKKNEINKPKYEFVTSHTARRSFATNEYKLRNLTTREIMSITGHKTEKSFYKYIRETPKESAERIKLIWRDREEGVKVGNLKAV